MGRAHLIQRHPDSGNGGSLGEKGSNGEAQAGAQAKDNEVSSRALPGGKSRSAGDVLALLWPPQDSGGSELRGEPALEAFWFFHRLIATVGEKKNDQDY